MSEWQWGNLVFLGLLGLALAGGMILGNRRSLNRMLQQAAAWGLIFLGTIAVIGLWDDIRQTVRPQQAVIAAAGKVTVPRAPDGHYYLTLDINDKPIEFLVDTGASEMVLTWRDAERAGVDLSNLAYTGRAMTANGEVRTAPIRLRQVDLGGIEDDNVRAWVNEGEMSQSLLGMSYLQRWSRIEIADRALVLTR